MGVQEVVVSWVRSCVTCSRKDDASFSRSTHLLRNSSSLDTPADGPDPDPDPAGRVLLLLLLLGGVALCRQRSEGVLLAAVTAGVPLLVEAARCVTTRSAALARSARWSVDMRAEALVAGADGLLRWVVERGVGRQREGIRQRGCVVGAEENKKRRKKGIVGGICLHRRQRYDGTDITE